ncbi:MAG: hypothetical protein AB8C02_10490 [Halioglobus sp.]
MEKVIYALWKKEGQAPDAFRDELLQTMAPALAQSKSVHSLRLCVADSAVEAAVGRRMAAQDPYPDAVASVWVDYAGDAQQWEPMIAPNVARYSAYLVAEAEPLVNQEAHPTAPGERMHGMCHVVFMAPPQDMDYHDWLAVWKDSHTQIAIDTQSTFGYRQNLVLRVLTEGAYACHAIVEENFPPEAMTDDHAFYATGGDAAVLKANMTAMMESCSRFIDFTKIDCIPMSEYLVKPLVARP